MENNETLTQAAARETLEEANARVEIGNLYTVYSLPHISQVYFYSAHGSWILISSQALKVWKLNSSAKKKCRGMNWLFALSMIR